MSIENIKKLRSMTGAGLMDVKKALDASNNNIEDAVDWLRKNGISKAAKKSDRIAAEGSTLVASTDKKVAIIEINTETDFVASNESFKTALKDISDILLINDISSNDLGQLNKLEVKGQTVEEIITNLTATIGEKISIRRFLVNELSGANVGIYNHMNGRISTFVIANNVSSEILKDVAMHSAAMNPEFGSESDWSKEKVAREEKVLMEQYKKQMPDKPQNILDNIVKGALNKTFGEKTLLNQQFIKDSSKKISALVSKDNFVSFSRYEVGEGLEKRQENFAEEVMKQVKG